MAFKKKPEQPEFASLMGILNQSKSKKDDALYKTLQYLIERLNKFQAAVNGDVVDVNNSVNTVNTTIQQDPNKKRSYVTVNDESLWLPNSCQLKAGDNIALDTTIQNEITISSTGGLNYIPMATGAEPLEIMSDGAGHVFLVAFNV